jgi:sigma-B regulation protein RsbU (phosphoserine phosphatase)
MLIGAAISSFYAIANWPTGFLVTVFIGAVIGGVTFVCVRAMQTAVGFVMRRARPSVQRSVNTFASVVAGAFGAVLGLVGGVRLAGGHLTIPEVLEGRGIPFVLATTVIALASSFVFHWFARLQTRVRETAWAERELQMAREIQERLLPPQHFEGDGFSIAARNLPASFVAGDFYDFVRNDDGSVTIVVADVAGKGMGASLIMASVKSALPFVAREPLAETMRLLNRKLIAELGKREFVALVCARYIPAAQTLEIANAGCPDPYLVRDAVVEALIAPGNRLPLGLRDDARYDSVTIRLATGDRVLFLSDGIPEAPRANGEPLGYDELVRVIAATDHAQRGAAWLDALLANVRARVEDGLADDWTAAVLDLSSST